MGAFRFLRFASLAVVLSAVHHGYPSSWSWPPHPLRCWAAALEARVQRARSPWLPNAGKSTTQGLLFDPVAAKEVKLFGLAPYLFDLYKSLFDAAFRRQSAIHRRQPPV